MDRRLPKKKSTSKFLRHLETSHKGKCARSEITSEYNIGYPTGQVSHFIHSQLIDAVNAHVYVLKDSLSLIRQLEALSFSPKQNILLTSADVAALYPSINMEDGMTALQWFMAEHTSIPQTLQQKYLKLARFVLANNYVECKGIEGSFLQRIGTAMGTSFSVTYAIIFI